jgi:transposase-like protein
MDKERECPRCGSTIKQNKHTAHKSGSERFICRICGKTYTPNPKKRGYSEEERTYAIKMYYECKSGRAVGRLLGISRSNAVRWIKERASKLPEKAPDAAENSEPVDVIELDEMFHFIKKKSEQKPKRTFI